MVSGMGTTPEDLPVFMFEHDTDVQKFVGEPGKRVLGVDDLRGEEGRHHRLIVLFGALPFIFGELVVVEVVDVVHAKARFHLEIELLSFLIERADRVEDAGELFFGCHTGFVVEGVRLGVHEIEQASHPDHKKLIQIACEDRDEFEPFEQRHRFVHRFRKDTIVKPQPG